MALYILPWLQIWTLMKKLNHLYEGSEVAIPVAGGGNPSMDLGRNTLSTELRMIFHLRYKNPILSGTVSQKLLASAHGPLRGLV